MMNYLNVAIINTMKIFVLFLNKTCFMLSVTSFE